MLFALTSAELLADTWRTGGVTLLGLAGYFFCPWSPLNRHSPTCAWRDADPDQGI